MYMQYLHNHVRFVNIIFKLFLNRLKKNLCVKGTESLLIPNTPVE